MDLCFLITLAYISSTVGPGAGEDTAAAGSGGRGKGEFAWRFSGFGDAGLAFELVALDDDSVK